MLEVLLSDILLDFLVFALQEREFILERVRLVHD